MQFEIKTHIPRYALCCKCLGSFAFYEYNAYVPEGGNEGERKATPTSISIFDSYDMKTL